MTQSVPFACNNDRLLSSLDREITFKADHVRIDGGDPAPNSKTLIGTYGFDVEPSQVCLRLARHFTEACNGKGSKSDDFQSIRSRPGPAYLRGPRLKGCYIRRLGVEPGDYRGDISTDYSRW
ncbi:MAG: hypothetical protein ACXW39_10660, partial [Nitrospira sp.]